MPPVYFAYNYLLSVFFLFLFPPFWFYSRVSGKYYESIKQRFGWYPEMSVPRGIGCPRIWIHAASVGEVRAADAIIRSLHKLLPKSSVILSTTTEHGHAYADRHLKTQAACVYMPVDFIPSVKKALSHFRPEMIVCLETEIWPNLFFQAKKMGIKTAIVNGRISTRSIKKYLMIRPLIQEALRYVDAFSMVSVDDAERIRQLGAPGSHIRVNGNAKFDLFAFKNNPAVRKTVQKLYDLSGIEPVFVAGSVRRAEEDVVLDAYLEIRRSISETILIIAPRHLERAESIRNKAVQKGLSCQSRTGLGNNDCRRTASVIVLDTIGELPSTYSVASIAFCGGSLVPLGGQNILEVAAWGRPVLFGPWMDDFLDAKELLLDSGGGIEVLDGRELAQKVKFYIQHPDLADKAGEAAQQTLIKNSGAASRHGAFICNMLS